MIKERLVRFDFSIISYHTYCGYQIIPQHPVFKSEDKHWTPIKQSYKKMTTDSKEMAELLADQYDSVFIKPIQEPQFLNPKATHTIQEDDITHTRINN